MTKLTAVLVIRKQKELFKIIDKIMHNYEEPQLPSHNSLDELVNKFADKNFWNQKTGDKQFNIKHLDWWKNIFTRIIGQFPSGYHLSRKPALILNFSIISVLSQIWHICPNL